MPRTRKKRKKVDVIAVRAGRALGKSYAQIGEELGVDASSVWYALNRASTRSRVDPPAGRQRSLHVTDERFAWLVSWAEEAGVTLSVMLGVVLDREAAFRSSQLELREAESQ